MLIFNAVGFSSFVARSLIRTFCLQIVVNGRGDLWIFSLQCLILQLRKDGLGCR